MLLLIFLFMAEIKGLKIWIPNTNIDNKLNWNELDTPKNCDNIRFQMKRDIAAFWNLKNLVVSGLFLSETGDIIFPHNINIQFRNKENCSKVRDLIYIRNKVKGWLDPDNWDSDSESQWLPHSERVPCAGETIHFPSQQTFAVQLPSILVPFKSVAFDNEVFGGESWSKFLQTELGFRFFKGPEDIRNQPWRADLGCFEKKKCICGRSSYTIVDGIYKEANPRIFEEAVCLYAMPKCESLKCYSPIIPEGHCCGICGAIIKLEDKTKIGLDIESLKIKINEELKKNQIENKLKTYVGRTKDENIQIVIVAENSDETLKSHMLANLIKIKLIDEKYQARISYRASGLTLSNYILNSISGVVCGTLLAVIMLFISVFYIYMILPKKKFQRSGLSNPFTFVRFENTLQENISEENLEIVQPKTFEETPQAFDNPMYSDNLEPNISRQNLLGESDTKLVETKCPTDATSTKEYINSVYKELGKFQKLNVLQEKAQEEEKMEEFIEIKF